METVDIQVVNDALKKLVNGQMRSTSSRGVVQGEIFSIFYDSATSYLYVFFWWQAAYGVVEEDEFFRDSWYIPPENLQNARASRIKLTPGRMKLYAEQVRVAGKLVIFETDDLGSDSIWSRCDFFPPGHEESLELEWIEGRISRCTH